jgi:V/A-type H+-transporting ATPase subunit A
MLKTIVQFNDRALEALDRGADITSIESLPVRDEIARMKYIANDVFAAEHEALERRLIEQLVALGAVA